MSHGNAPSVGAGDAYHNENESHFCNLGDIGGAPHFGTAAGDVRLEPGCAQRLVDLAECRRGDLNPHAHTGH